MHIRIDDLTGPGIRALLEEHLADMHALSPPESVHALDLSRLRGPDITFWTAWEGSVLAGCGALRHITPTHGEVKSMRTPGALRRRGAGRAVLRHLIGEARARGYRRLSLETGSQPGFEPARALYRSFGFTPCGPFADYREDPNSFFMTLELPSFPAEGGCDCGHVRYRMESAPVYVHCCHCRWCQRESGAAFALNAMIEADRVTLLSGEVRVVDTPSASGRGQRIARCPHCHVALWSNYAGAGPRVRFVRVGTLDNPDLLPPDIHIFTASKQPWVVLPPGTPAVPEYYDRDAHWPPESLARRRAWLEREE